MSEVKLPTLQFYEKIRIGESAAMRQIGFFHTCEFQFRIFLEQAFAAINAIFDAAIDRPGRGISRRFPISDIHQFL